jgi:hypothetical protein
MQTHNMAKLRIEQMYGFKVIEVPPSLCQTEDDTLSFQILKDMFEVQKNIKAEPIVLSRIMCDYRRSLDWITDSLHTFR